MNVHKLCVVLDDCVDSRFYFNIANMKLVRNLYLIAGFCPNCEYYLEEVEIEGMVWPARRPDLNAIDNLSVTLGRRLQEKRNQLYRLADLVLALDKIDLHTIRPVNLSMKRRCQNYIRAGDANTLTVFVFFHLILLFLSLVLYAKIYIVHSEARSRYYWKMFMHESDPNYSNELTLMSTLVVVLN